MSADPVDAVVVRIRRDRYAVPMPSVAEVGRLPALTRVPGLPEWVAGVVNWRGRVLPVLDLVPLLQDGAVPAVPTADEPERRRLVVIGSGGITAGVVVDDVLTTSTYDGAAVTPLPVALPPGGAALVDGQFPTAGGPVAVLDCDAVLRLRERLPQTRRSA